jgi:hypothetical protein
MRIHIHRSCPAVLILTALTADILASPLPLYHVHDSISSAGSLNPKKKTGALSEPATSSSGWFAHASSFRALTSSLGRPRLHKRTSPDDSDNHDGGRDNANKPGQNPESLEPSSSSSRSSSGSGSKSGHLSDLTLAQLDEEIRSEDARSAADAQFRMSTVRLMRLGNNGEPRTRAEDQVEVRSRRGIGPALQELAIRGHAEGETSVPIELVVSNPTSKIRLRLLGVYV